MSAPAAFTPQEASPRARRKTSVRAMPVLLNQTLNGKFGLAPGLELRDDCTLHGLLLTGESEWFQPSSGRPVASRVASKS